MDDDGTGRVRNERNRDALGTTELTPTKSKRQATAGDDDSELDDSSYEDGGGDARMADVAAGGATPAATAGCIAEFSEDFSAAVAAAAGK